MVLDDHRAGAAAPVYNHGYAASREQAMRYFKVRYIGPSNWWLAFKQSSKVVTQPLQAGAVALN